MKKNPKISKGKANYRPSTSDIENCKNCRLFLYDTTGNGKHGCQVIEGLINPNFVSDLFQPQVDFGDNGVTPEAFPVPINNPNHIEVVDEADKADKADKAANTANMQMGVSANPLLPGFSRETVSENIAREIRAGKEQDQAIAISLDNARREFRKKNKRGRFPKHLREKNPQRQEPLDVGNIDRAIKVTGTRGGTSVRNWETIGIKPKTRGTFNTATGVVKIGNTKIGTADTRRDMRVLIAAKMGWTSLGRPFSDFVRGGKVISNPKHKNPKRNPSCPSCNNPIKNPSIIPGNYTCSGCGSNITVAKANPDLLPGTDIDEKFGNAIVIGAGIATGSVIAQAVLNGRKGKGN